MATVTVGQHSRGTEEALEVAIFVDMLDLSDDVLSAFNATADAFLDYIADCERATFEDGVFFESDEIWTTEQQHYEEVMNR